jgi:hypothetical protein
VLEETGMLDDDADWEHSIGREETPWSSCPREMKLKSFKKLPELLGLIADRASEMTEESRKTSSTVRELMDALGDGPPAPVAVKPDNLIEPLGPEFGQEIADSVDADADADADAAAWLTPAITDFPFTCFRSADDRIGADHVAVANYADVRTDDDNLVIRFRTIIGKRIDGGLRGPGRPGGCPPDLPQIRTCPIKASGSSRRSSFPLLYSMVLR